MGLHYSPPPCAAGPWLGGEGGAWVWGCGRGRIGASKLGCCRGQARRSSGNHHHTQLGAWSMRPWGQALPRTEHGCRRLVARCRGHRRAHPGQMRGAPWKCPCTPVWVKSAPGPIGLCTGTNTPVLHPTAAASHPTAPRGCLSPYSSAGAGGASAGLTPQSSLPTHAGEPVSVITFLCFLPNSSTESLFAIHLPWDFIGI